MGIEYLIIRKFAILRLMWDQDKIILATGSKNFHVVTPLEDLTTFIQNGNWSEIMK